MNILHTVEFYWPHQGGAQEVVRQVSEYLVKRGHSVTVATSRLSDRRSKTLNGVRIEEFDISGNEVRGFRGDTRSYEEFLLDSPFDVMMNYAAQQWTTDLVFSLLARLSFKKVLAPCGFSGLHDPAYLRYFQQMPQRLTQYDRLIFHSATYQDAVFASKHGIRQSSVIPNGASPEEFQDGDGTDFRKLYGIPANALLLLTVGNHEALKGHGLIIEAFRRARIGHAVLAIVGRPLSIRGCLLSCTARGYFTRAISLGRKRVLLLELPRQEVIAAFRAADLFVLGSNVECSPLVLFEAMASKTPFIATDCGNAREIADWGKGGVVVPGKRLLNGRVQTEPSAMRRAIEDLAAEPGSRETLAKTGHSVWKERFTWGHIAELYETLYYSLLNPAGR